MRERKLTLYLRVLWHFKDSTRKYTWQDSLEKESRSDFICRVLDGMKDHTKRRIVSLTQMHRTSSSLSLASMPRRPY
jgi:hypothetical protein